MSKRMLSWILTCALLLGCLSGLSLMTSAAESVTLVNGSGYLNTNGFFNTNDMYGHFDLGVEDGTYDLKVTFQYKTTTANPWWQARVKCADDANIGDSATYKTDADGNAYSGDGFQQPICWVKTTNGTWASHSVSFANVKLNNTVENNADFGFHICNAGDLLISYIVFEITDTTDTTVTKTWGQDLTDADTVKALLETNVTAADAMDVSIYTAKSQAAFQTALTSAKTVLALDTATADDLRAALDALDKAVASLAEPIAVGTQTTIACTQASERNGGSIEDHEGYSCIGSTFGGAWADFPLNVATAGDYQVTMQIATNNGGPYTVSLRDEEDTTLGTVSVSNTGGWQVYSDFVIGSVALPQGNQVLRVYFNDGGVNYKNMTLTMLSTDSAKAALEETIAAAKPHLDNDTYTDVSKAALQTAITAAETVLANEDATVSELSNAEVAVKNAVSALQNIIVVDLAVDATLELKGADFTGKSDEILVDGADGTTLGWTDTGRYVDYQIDVKNAGSYDVTWGLSNGAAATDKVATVTMQLKDVDATNYAAVGEDIEVYGSDAWTGTYNDYTKTVSLKKGVQTVRLYYTDGSANLGYVKFTYKEAAVQTQVTGHSLTLSGDIGVNFITNLSAADAENATMEFAWGDMTASADAVATTDGYKFTCNVAAKEMADTITATLKVNGKTVATDTYSVKEYAAVILEDATTYANEQAIVKAMLNYGGYAQTYFGYNPNAMANAGLTDTDVSSVTAESLVTYKNTAVQGNADIAFVASNLSLLSKTTLRLYFSSNAGAVEVGGEALTLVESGNNTYPYCVEIVNIAAQDLDETISVTLKDSAGETIVTFNYNVMSYCYNVLNRSTNTNLQNAVRALCLYNQAANAYVA